MSTGADNKPMLIQVSYDEYQRLIRKLDAAQDELEAAEDINEQYRVKLEAAEARVKELEQYKKAWESLSRYIDKSGPFPYKAFENLDKEMK